MSRPPSSSPAGWSAWHLFYQAGLDLVVTRFVRPLVRSLLADSAIQGFFKVMSPIVLT